jgi:phosphopantothenoylcysteine synthetase/decarboxylase
MSRIVLGVGAGIAAYKVCELLRRLSEAGHDVRVVPTADALRFVGEPTWAALSGHPVSTGVWDEVSEVPHVRLGQQADLVFVAPATADLLARAAHGLAADLLTNTLLTARCPVVYAPAMHTEMWEHPATQANVATLRSRGAIVVDPASGRLTGADSGPGRLPDPAGTRTVKVSSAEEMRKAVLEAADGADVVVMAAAVADFRPADYRDFKIKKTESDEPEPIRLVKNPDILSELVRRRGAGQVVVGFAAETDDVLAHGRAKLVRKGCDMLVVNQVGADLTFGRPDNAAVVLTPDAAPVEVPRGPKEALADVVWDLVAARLE